MNERLQELKKQAYELAVKDLETNDPASYYSDRGPAVAAVIDKFAELLVRACDNYVDERYDECEPWMRPGDLLKLFGVEE